MKRQRAEISSNVISHIKSAHPIEMWRSNKLGIKEKISRGNFPRLIFSCPVPSGLPHRSHCVPMNMNPCGYRVLLELLGRFELPTSSLPNIYRLLFLVVPFCFLFSESIGITCVCRFPCRFLLSAVALYLLRFFDDCCGFVAVSIEPPFLAHL